MAQEDMFCEQCGDALEAGTRFCEHCGAAVATPPAVEVPVQETLAMEWVGTLSILKNKVVVTQLGLVFFIPLLVVGLVVGLSNRPSTPEEWGFLLRIVLITGAVFLGLLLIAILIVYGGRYEYEFRLNDQGIGGRPHGKTAKKNRIINLLLLFSGKPTPTGTGLMAMSRQEEYVAWNKVDTVIADERHRTITLQKGKRPLMVVPCDEAHYAAVLDIAQQAAARTRSRRAK